MKEKYESKGVHFLSLTIEPEDDAERVASWLKKAGAPGLNAARASEGIMPEFVRMGGSEPGVIPANVFISAGGAVTRSLVAPFSHEDLEAAIEAIAQ